MAIKTRLDRFLRKQLGLNQTEVRLLLAQNKVYVDQQIATDTQLSVNAFSHIRVDGAIIQAEQAVYIMLNKPKGIVSATKDKRHKTVLDLIDHPQKQRLHIVGRLDLNTTGLLLLTNDGTWSRQISLPGSKLPKRYRVTLQNPIDKHYIDAFKNGMYFPYEGITTLPADLSITNNHEAEVCLREGKYHQIKRMFGRFDNPVTQLHRLSVGNLKLEPALQTGAYRSLSKQEVGGIFDSL